MAGCTTVDADTTGTPATAELDANTLTAESEEELPPGFYLSGEFVELGPFDPKDTTIEPIRACEEIPDDVLEAAGMKMGGVIPGTDLPYEGPQEVQIGDMLGCGGLADYEDRDLVRIGATSGPNTVAAVAQTDIVFDEAASTIVPNLTVHRGTYTDNPICTASIDTARGLLSITASDLIHDSATPDLCAFVQHSVETIYIQLRGKHHHA